MSKTRTGRKGRARLAVAGHLDATGQGRTDADNLTETQLLERLGGFATGDGASGAYFSNGEEVGAILDDICEKSGIYSDDETAGGSPLSADVDGEESLAASGDLPQLSGGPFRHYYIKAKDTVKTDAIAAARATGLQATETHGIAYLQSGPGAKFIPSNHGLTTGDFVAFSVSPDFDAVKESDYTKMTYVMLGNVDGHTVEGTITQHVQASASFKIAGADTDIESGDEFRIIGRDDEILLKIIASDSGENGVSGPPELVRYAIDGNNIFILRGGGITDAEAASGMAEAINEWAGLNAKDLNASATDETVTVTMQKYQGTSGNNSVDSALASLTITALKKQGVNPDSLVPLDGVSAKEMWFTDTSDNPVAHVVFANGDSTSTPFLSDGGAGTSFKVQGGINTDFINEDDKFVNTELELTVQIGGDTLTPVDGLALAWSLSEE